MRGKKGAGAVRAACLCLMLCACEPVSLAQDYREARVLFWDELYIGGGRTLYCGERFSTFSRKGLNIEHVFPMSWVTKALDCGTRTQCRRNSPLFNQIESDLHNLFPSRQDVNTERNSFRFAEIDGEVSAIKECDFEVDYRRRRVEPREASRGEIARAMFYMRDRYPQAGLEIFDSQARLLLEWHRNDPPDDHERRRNDVIERLQGNRNSYIDDPDLLLN